MTVRVWHSELEIQDSSRTPSNPCRKCRVHVEAVGDPERIAYFEANIDKF